MQGFAINAICVIADGGRNGLWAGSSVPDGGWSLHLHFWKIVINCKLLQLYYAK